MVERCSEKESAQRKLTYVDTRHAVIPREKVPGVCCADALAPGGKKMQIHQRQAVVIV